MTGPSKRDLTRRVEALAEDHQTTELEVRIVDELVIERERAEREGREILGPANVPADGDYVRVPMERNAS